MEVSDGKEGIAEESRASTAEDASLPGVTHTLPRYTMAGNNGTIGGISGSSVVGVPPSEIASPFPPSLSTFGASLPRMSAAERVGKRDFPPIHAML